MGEKMINAKTSILNNKVVNICILLAFAILTLIGAINHELWFDEAQAWTIARDNNISGIFDQLKYEGHPPLWYLILYVFSHLGFSCDIIPLISWFFTVAAAAIIMFKSPFSTITKAAVLFSGGFLFFNSVISRVYCLINLIMVIIAWLYPKRKEHPILFGMLIALLANTHICVSGFIGIIGIFMIIDLFKDWKSNSVKKNTLNLIGLAISGIGVLTMVLPLLNSLNLNSSTSKNELTLKLVLNSIIDSPLNISLSLIGSYCKYLPIYLISGVISVLFIVLVLLMRHKIKPFLMLIFFCAFYIITTEICWFTIPNRAHVFVLAFFIILWIAEYEPENNMSTKKNKLKLNADTKIIKNIIAFVCKIDRNYLHSYNVIITLILISSIPIGAMYLINDYTKPFCPSKDTAEYIKSNFPENTVFVTDGEIVAQLAAYLPEYKFYSLSCNELNSYVSHKKIETDSTDYLHAYNVLKDYDNIYHLFVAIDSEYYNDRENILYTNRSGATYSVNTCYMEISEFDLEKEIGASIK
ncbi:MAG: hypothetical protein ACI4KG_08490 [Oscillospiraceae bacterium]